jgi:hypothetical protein
MNCNDTLQESIENLNTNLERASKGIVFISNKSGHDFSDSKRYGAPVYVTVGQVNRFSVGYMARKWMRCLLASKKEDYILLTSLTILTVVGASIFGWMHGRLNLLIFRNNKYIARTIVFDQLRESEKEALDEQ